MVGILAMLTMFFHFPESESHDILKLGKYFELLEWKWVRWSLVGIRGYVRLPQMARTTEKTWDTCQARFLAIFDFAVRNLFRNDVLMSKENAQQHFKKCSNDSKILTDNSGGWTVPKVLQQSKQHRYILGCCRILGQILICFFALLNKISTISQPNHKLVIEDCYYYLHIILYFF